MSQSRKNRRKNSKSGTVVSQSSHQSRVFEILMERNRELMFDFMQRIRTEDTEDMPYGICDVKIDSPILGMTLNMSIIHRQVTDSECDKFIASEFYDDIVNTMIEERIEDDIPRDEPQCRVLPCRDFIGFMLSEECDFEDSDSHYPDIDFPIGPISMN